MWAQISRILAKDPAGWSLEGALGPVLDVLLSDAVAPDPPLDFVRPLLAASKATAARVTQRLLARGAGLAVVAKPGTLAEARALSAWLLRHGRLVLSLEFELRLAPAPSQSRKAKAPAGKAGSAPPAGGANADAGAAFRQAVARGGVPRLAALKCRAADAGTDKLLSWLPQSLQRLDLALAAADCYDERSEQVMSRDYPRAISRLTNLVSLKLDVQGPRAPYDAVHITPPMARLTRLTELVLEGAHLGEADGVDPDTIQGLPTSLRGLTAPLYCSGCLDLSRLTALTELTLTQRGGRRGGVGAGDALPASLRRLDCEVHGVKPLLGLTNLQELLQPVRSAAQLAALGRLTALTRVELREWARAGAAPPAAPTPYRRGGPSLEAVLDVVLSESAVPDPPLDVVLPLLMASKAMAARVTQRLLARGAGLAVPAAPQTLEEAEAFGAWLLRHGRLVGSIEFEPRLGQEPFEGDDAEAGAGEGGSAPAAGYAFRVETNADAGAALAAALRAAAARGGLARLASFTCRAADADSDRLLAALPKNLERLDLAYGTDSESEFEPCTTREYRSALGRLTNLVSLKIDVQGPIGAGYRRDYDAVYVTPAMAKITRLTELEISGAYLGEANGIHPATIKGMPASLRRLTAPMYCYQCLNLNRLKALTELKLEPAGIDEGDKLPASLQKLDCKIVSVKPLLKLKSLWELVQPVSAAQAAELRRLTALTRVEVGQRSYYY